MDRTAHFPRSKLIPEAPHTAHIRLLLRSNSQPPQHLPFTISALSGEVARYDTEISRLKAELSKLEADRAALHGHCDGCRGLLSPIRRLPSEILVEIFALYERSFTPVFDARPKSSSSLDIEMSRLAKTSLLAVSAVCARWHTIVMGTPTLWTTIELHSDLWSGPAAKPDTVLSLLQAVLERGGNNLLDLVITVPKGNASHGPALELLAAHSERWQSARIISWDAGLEHFSAAKGRLPRLETLMLGGTPSPIDIFEIAPRLEDLEVASTPFSVVELPKLPLHQLKGFRCMELWGCGELMQLGMSPTLSLMPHLTEQAEFDLQLSHIDEFPGFVPSDASLAPITSQIYSFVVDVGIGFDAASIKNTLAKIADSLTLPALEHLIMNSQEYPRLVLPWPHSQFLGLAARSSFHVHLLSLDLHHSVITEAELLECLDALPSLEDLTIADHTDHHLITDSLFAALTRSPSACLTPHLRSLSCLSTLRFDDSVWLQFVLSRLTDDERDPFACGLWWLHGHYRRLDRRVDARIEELEETSQLLFDFEPLGI
ncbi:hypothetical protein DFH09DRAFT_1132159 [Mycena vulgaris]|nr:hypothetical protein DFH09DRAFT_1132159 [Mycena vulgaris]